MKHRHSLIIVSLASVILAGVFMLYTRPEFLVQLSNQIWACF